MSSEENTNKVGLGEDTVGVSGGVIGMFSDE